MIAYEEDRLEDLELRDKLAAQVETERTIRRLVGPCGDRMPRERAQMIVRLAARNIRADKTGTLTKTRAINEARNVEFSADGDPQRFPFDNASSNAIRLAQQNPDNAHLAELAQSVRDHRDAYRRGHTIACRGDLHRGYCH